jgi:cyanate permease
MDQSKKAFVYKYMFLVSTVLGVFGVYFLYKQLVILGWMLVCGWAVLAVFVRILIIKDKKFFKNNKI